MNTQNHVLWEYPSTHPKTNKFLMLPFFSCSCWKVFQKWTLMLLKKWRRWKVTTFGKVQIFPTLFVCSVCLFMMVVTLVENREREKAWRRRRKQKGEEEKVEQKTLLPFPHCWTLSTTTTKSESEQH